MLFLVVGDDLQDDEPVGERRLGGQVGLARCSPAELAEEAERAESLADFREDRGPRERAEQAIATQEDLEFLFPLGKSAHDLGRGHALTRLAAQADLLVDQADGVLGLESGPSLQEFLDGDVARRAPRPRPSPGPDRDTQALSSPHDRPCAARIDFP